MGRTWAGPAGPAIPVGMGSMRAGPLWLGACVFAGLAVLGARLLGDPDTLWHVALGARIWREGAVPWTDDYSHTFAGHPWIAKEWLSQLILYGAHRAAGWGGVVALAAATLAGTLAALFAFLLGRLRATAALAATLLAILFVAPHALARPHVFALAALLAWAIGLVRAVEAGRAPSPLLLGIVVLWANLHGSVTFAFPLAALLGAEAVAQAPAGARAGLAVRWMLFGLGTLAAGCLTPYGVHAMAVTATIFGSGESLPYVIEWRPLAWDATGCLAMASAAGLVGALAVEPRRNLFRIAGVAGLALMAMRHTRFLDLFALLAPVLAAAPLARGWSHLRPEPIAAAPAAATVSRLAPAALASVALAFLLARPPSPDPAVTPAAALAEAHRIGLAGPVYNDYDFGGFLMAAGVPTFIDGRTDQLFLGGFISGLYRAVESEEDRPFLDLLDRRGVDWALVRPEGLDTRHLDRAPGWRRAYADRVAVLFVRR